MFLNLKVGRAGLTVIAWSLSQKHESSILDYLRNPLMTADVQTTEQLFQEKGKVLRVLPSGRRVPRNQG